ncbi:MAG: flagellar motor protein MotB [Desulfovibrio sp.]|jgi:chemotaxis protein MotB|nr:flagellar motor protein MotB [Desulfovibrio sp.]
MAGGSWKVAYADFVTAMMAFFLLMWLLSISDEETKKGLAAYFTAGAKAETNITTPIGLANNPLIQYVDKLDSRTVKEIEESSVAIVKAIRQYLMQDAVPSASSGVTSDGIGVLLHLTPDLMFKPGTLEFTASGQRALDEVVKVMQKYKVYLVVRGHTDASETGAPGFPSKWELASARANAAVRYLIAQGVDPGYVRSVSYADTRPKALPNDPNRVVQNGRVEFFFHRPEVMSTVVGY